MTTHDSNMYLKVMETKEIIEYLIELNHTYLEGDYIDYLKTNYYFILKSIKLNELEKNIDHNWRQTRSQFEKERIEKYKKLDINNMPPILVINNTIVDGYHRYCVAKECGKNEMIAYVNRPINGE